MGRKPWIRSNNTRYFIKLFKRNNVEFWERPNFFEFIIKKDRYQVSIVTKNTRKFGTKKWKYFNPKDYKLK